MRGPHVALAFGAVVLFVCGMAVGQRARPSKFAKYQEPASISGMDWLLLQAKVDQIKELFPLRTGISPPEFGFRPDGNKVVAISLVDAKRLQAEPAGEATASLKTSAMGAQAAVLYYVPELADKDFEMYFKTCCDKAGFYTYAEYKNGQLVMH
ncbi:MAG: hypothetical protein ABSG54_14230 [Terriglobia bacterium]|jgi:hypothetical protein